MDITRISPFHLCEALSLVFRAEVRTLGASRTDAGVHANGLSALVLDQFWTSFQWFSMVFNGFWPL